MDTWKYFPACKHIHLLHILTGLIDDNIGGGGNMVMTLVPTTNAFHLWKLVVSTGWK